VQPSPQQKPVQAAKPSIPVDILLNSDNNLSEDIQPILVPLKSNVNTDNEDKK
jgi:hypothetical protein